MLDAELGQPRPDIADHLGRPGDPVLQASGWTARGLATRPIRLDDIVAVTATCETGRTFVLDSSLVLHMLKRTDASIPHAPVQRRLPASHTAGTPRVPRSGRGAGHSHSIVPGGLLVMSSTTRPTGRISLIIRDAIRSSRS